jgi:hypothetical protein
MIANSATLAMETEQLSKKIPLEINKVIEQDLPLIALIKPLLP